jgi:hypothetical protein
VMIAANSTQTFTMSAMGNPPFEPRTALPMVDAQIGLVALMSAEVRDSVLGKIKTLLTEAGTSGIPVIYIQRDGARTPPADVRRASVMTLCWQAMPTDEGQPSVDCRQYRRPP